MVALDGARILRAESGTLTAPSDAEPSRIGRDFLRDRGADRGADRAVDQLRVSSQINACSGIKHLRLEQEIDGLRVYGAYVKATIRDRGELVQVIERAARPTGAMAPLHDQDALVAALAALGYEVAVPAKTRAHAEAQDGSGTDNANFSTPADGSSPRMLMYPWSIGAELRRGGQRGAAPGHHHSPFRRTSGPRRLPTSSSARA